MGDELLGSRKVPRLQRAFFSMPYDWGLIVLFGGILPESPMDSCSRIVWEGRDCCAVSSYYFLGWLLFCYSPDMELHFSLPVPPKVREDMAPCWIWSIHRDDRKAKACQLPGVCLLFSLFSFTPQVILPAAVLPLEENCLASS